MKKETYRASRLVWFTILLLALSSGILYSAAIIPAAPVNDPSGSTETLNLEPSPEPANPRPLTATEQREFIHFVATAYSVRGTTASGVSTNTGIVAADPNVLPIGSVIEVRLGTHSGIYTVLDTGSFIKGKRIDIYMPDTDQAHEFGRRTVKIRILRHGWNIAPPNFG